MSVIFLFCVKSFAYAQIFCRCQFDVFYFENRKVVTTMQLFGKLLMQNKENGTLLYNTFLSLYGTNSDCEI